VVPQTLLVLQVTTLTCQPFKDQLLLRIYISQLILITLLPPLLLVLLVLLELLALLRPRLVCFYLVLANGVPSLV
jgi:hypothetical protein